MKYRYIFIIGISMGLSSCLNILLKQELLQTEAFTPKINHTYSVLNQGSNGFLFDYNKKFYGKDDSTSKCVTVLRKEKYNLKIDLNGNIVNQTRNTGYTYSGKDFYNGKPYDISKSDILKNRVFLTFYDLTEKKTNSFEYDLSSRLPSGYSLTEKYKIKFFSEKDYYFYGIVKNKADYRLFIARVLNEDLIDIAYSEPSLEIVSFNEPIVLPNGEMYMIALLRLEVAPGGINVPTTQDWILKYTPSKKDLSYFIEISDIPIALFERPLMFLNGELLIFPDYLVSANSKLKVYAVSISDRNLQEKAIPILNFDPKFDIKTYWSKNQQYIGYTNLQKETKIYKLNIDLSLSQSFLVNSLENIFVVSFENSDKLFEFYSKTITEEKVQTKVRIHNAYNLFSEKMLFEGVELSKKCEQ